LNTPACHWSRPTRRPVPKFYGVLTQADFAQLYAERYGHAVGFASKFVGLVEAEDIVQNVFLYIILARLDTLPDLRPTRLFAWVKYAARHEMKTAWRRHVALVEDLADVEEYGERHGRERSVQLVT
jgi:DNA-directed RNA polymerase specialized sigma24 family protein